MIFCTVGNSRKGFDRMLQAVDIAAESTDEPFVCQTGYSKYTPIHCKFFAFANRDSYLEDLRASRLLVSHGGAGTVVDARTFGRPIVIFPRRKELGECMDDFFVEFANVLASEGMAQVCLDVDSLVASCAADSRLPPAQTRVKDARLAQALRLYLRQVLPEPDTLE